MLKKFFRKIEILVLLLLGIIFRPVTTISYIKRKKLFWPGAISFSILYLSFLLYASIMAGYFSYLVSESFLYSMLVFSLFCIKFLFIVSLLAIPYIVFHYLFVRDKGHENFKPFFCCMGLFSLSYFLFLIFLILVIYLTKEPPQDLEGKTPTSKTLMVVFFLCALMPFFYEAIFIKHFSSFSWLQSLQRSFLGWVGVIIAHIAILSLVPTINKVAITHSMMRSRSMQPTIIGDMKDGDRVTIDSFYYWFYPKKRGDIVVYESEDSLILKRIVGLPGETIHIIEPHVYINGKKLAGSFYSQIEYADGKRDRFLRDYLKYAVESPLTVPAESYFVLGDNSSNSFDSRMVGCITEDKVKGRVTGIWYPFERTCCFLNPPEDG